MSDTLAADEGFLSRVLHSPFALQCVLMVVLLGFFLGFRPAYQTLDIELFTTKIQRAGDTYAIGDPGFFVNNVSIRTVGLEEVWVTAEDGNTITVVRPKAREQEMAYTVQEGDTVTKVAHRFGLEVSTVLWANDLTVRSTLTPGEEIRIPQQDGVYYSVKREDTLSEIAQRHGVGLAEVMAANGVSADAKLTVTQELFIPGAKRIFIEEKPVVVAQAKPAFVAPSSTGYQSSATTNYKDNAGVSSINSMDVEILRPTAGSLTQGYTRSHYALDLANKWHTPIYAAADGVVTVSQNGWNYGYGNYIIIDHGNGIETLYGHNDLREVSVGEAVVAGQEIALMGNTGRVFGKTGIHLHFELRINGRKVNPANYFVD